MKFENFFIIFSLSVIIAGCGNELEAITVSKVQRVTNFELSLNELPAVSIAIGPDERNYFDITIYRSNIKSGYVAASKANNESAISIEANWSGKHFVQSSNHNTKASVEIISIDPAGEIAIIKVSATLVNPETGELLQLADSKITISGENFINLTRA